MGVIHRMGDKTHCEFAAAEANTLYLITNVLVTSKKNFLSFLSRLFFYFVIAGVVDNVVECVVVAILSQFVLLEDELCMLYVVVYGFHVATGRSFVIGAVEICNCFGGL